MRWLAAVILVAAVGAWYFDPRYYAAAELDRKPYPLRAIELDFPPMPSGADYYGKLKMHLYIGRSGEVDRVEVVAATLPPSLRDFAVKTFAQVRWEPGRKLGRSVRSIKVVEVDLAAPTRGAGRAPMQPER